MNAKMKRISGLIGLASLLFCVTTASAQFRETIKASGNYRTKEVKIEKFNQIKLLGSLAVVYTQSTNGRSELKITGSDNLLDLVECKVVDNTLSVQYRGNVNVRFGTVGRLQIIASSPSLKEVELQGSGDVILQNELSCTNLTLNLIGSGDIKADGIVCTGKFLATLQGSGDIVVLKKVHAASAALKLFGSGDLQVNNLVAKSASADLQGSGDLNVRGANTIGDANLKLNGSGNLDFVGIKADYVKADLQGSGDLKVAGSTQQAALFLINSGDLDAQSLHAVDVAARLEGSGDITCFASGSLKCSIRGSGDISYKGNPSDVQSSGRNKPREM